MGEWQGMLAGFTLGATHVVFYGSYALAVWYGARRVADGDLNGGKFMTVMMSCILGGFQLGQVRVWGGAVVAVAGAGTGLGCAVLGQQG